MEILKLDIIGSYSYKHDIEIVSYDKNNSQYTKECVVCKKSILDPSYETLSSDKNINNNTNNIIKKYQFLTLIVIKISNVIFYLKNYLSLKNISCILSRLKF